jgi:hypothetical protein
MIYVKRMTIPDPTRKRVPQSQMELLIETLEKESKKAHSENPELQTGPFTAAEMALAQKELEQHLDKSLYYLLTDGSHLISFSTKEWLLEMWRWTSKSSDLSEYLPFNLWPDWCKKEGLIK